MHTGVSSHTQSSLPALRVPTASRAAPNTTTPSILSEEYATGRLISPVWSTIRYPVVAPPIYTESRRIRSVPLQKPQTAVNNPRVQRRFEVVVCRAPVSVKLVQSLQVIS